MWFDTMQLTGVDKNMGRYDILVHQAIRENEEMLMYTTSYKNTLFTKTLKTKHNSVYILSKCKTFYHNKHNNMTIQSCHKHSRHRIQKSVVYGNQILSYTFGT